MQKYIFVQNKANFKTLISK